MHSVCTEYGESGRKSTIGTVLSLFALFICNGE